MLMYVSYEFVITDTHSNARYCLFNIALRANPNAHVSPYFGRARMFDIYGKRAYIISTPKGLTPTALVCNSWSSYAPAPAALPAVAIASAASATSACISAM